MGDLPAAVHTPVLLAEVIQRLHPQPGMRMLDCTLGLGGHAVALARAGADVVGIDRDGEARSLARERFASEGLAGKLTVRAATFADAVEELVKQGERFDGVLADLGVSSMQLDREDRGFSWRSETSPDMRMGDGCPETALDLIARSSEEQLATILYEYGEERLSRRVSRSIKLAHAAGALTTNAQLAAVVRAAIPGHHTRHPAMRTFQALRIAVNDELGQLERLLAVLPQLTAPGGRAVVISFHSLEDRAVKEVFRDGLQAGLWEDVARKVITASDEELAVNPRATPAKLRWALRAASSSTSTTSATGISRS